MVYDTWTKVDLASTDEIQLVPASGHSRTKLLLQPATSFANNVQTISGSSQFHPHLNIYRRWNSDFVSFFFWLCWSGDLQRAKNRCHCEFRRRRTKQSLCKQV